MQEVEEIPDLVAREKMEDEREGNESARKK